MLSLIKKRKKSERNEIEIYPYIDCINTKLSIHIDRPSFNIFSFTFLYQKIRFQKNIRSFSYFASIHNITNLIIGRSARIPLDDAQASIFQTSRPIQFEFEGRYNPCPVISPTNLMSDY